MTPPPPYSTACRPAPGEVQPSRRNGVFLLCLWVALAVLAVGAVLWVVRPTIRLSHLIAMTHEGDRIIAAAKRYVADHGTPPARVEDLVPNYLPAVPASKWGWRAWEILSTRGSHRQDPRVFMVVRFTRSGYRLLESSGYYSISCYVYPDGRQNVWNAVKSLPGFEEEVVHLRPSSE